MEKQLGQNPGLSDSKPPLEWAALCREHKTTTTPQIWPIRSSASVQPWVLHSRGQDFTLGEGSEWVNLPSV